MEPEKKPTEHEKIVSMIDTKSGILLATEKSVYRLYEGKFRPIPIVWVDNA